MNKHHKDCGEALMDKLGLPRKYFEDNPDKFYRPPHNIGFRDIYGMFDCGIWYPPAQLEILIAVSSHAAKKKSIDRHNLLDANQYIQSPNKQYYLVTWKKKKRVATPIYRFYSLPDMKELWESG